MRRMHCAVTVVGIVGSLAGCSESPLKPATVPAAAATQRQFVDGARLIVALRTAGAPAADLVAAIKAAGGRVERTHGAIGVLVVSGLPGSAARALAARGDIKTVVADRRVPMLPPHWRIGVRDAVGVNTAPANAARVSAVRVSGVRTRGNPTTAQFYLDSTQWNMRITKANQAWGTTIQGAGARVCILDTGVDPGHIDLQGKVDPTRDTSFVFDSLGAIEPVANDSVGHGSFVAAIISSNSLGVAAVAPQATLCAVKVLGNDGTGSFADILSGILYASDVGADAINMSFGGYLPANDAGALDLVTVLQQAVDYAVGRGAALFAAAGNDAINTNTGVGPGIYVADSINTPAALTHVVSVGATAPMDQANFDRIAGYSDYGSPGVDVFAPGGDLPDTLQLRDLVISVCSRYADTVCKDGLHYAIGAGTSFASPHVAGESAVVVAQSGFSVRGRALEQCVLSSADEIAGLRINPLYGYGRIDVLTAAQGCNTPWSFVP